MIATLTLAFHLSTAPVGVAPPDSWFAEDKLRHFFTSFVATSFAASGARIVGADLRTSQWVGVGTGATIGVVKEWSDARAGGPFSGRDLVWDAAGIGTAYLLLDQAR